jgi:hypothetical protein
MRTGAAVTIIGGITTQLLAVMLWYVGLRFFHGDVLKLWFNVILPFGALMLGVAGGWGFYLAGRLAKQPSTSGLRWTAVAIALATVLSIRFLGYWNMEVEGVPVHRMIGFIPYLQATLGHAHINFSHGMEGLGSVDVGALGYFLEMAEWGAYVAASYGFAAKLPQALRCERCNDYMHESLWGSVRIDNQRVFEERYLALPREPAARLIALRAMESEIEAPLAGAVDLHYRLVECPGCSAAAVAESGKVHTGKYWAPCKALIRIGRFDRSRPAAVPQQPPVAGLVTPGIRTFGRRTPI